MKELYTEKSKVESRKSNERPKAKVESQKSDKKDEKATKQTKKQGNAYRILIRPLVTEKLNSLKEKGKYGFEAAPFANKVEIAKAIEEVYGVKPKGVNIVKVLGKKVRRGKTTGKRKDWKKAIITLPKDKELEIYKGV